MKTVFGSGNGSDDDGSWLNSLRGRGLFPLLKWGAIGLAVLFLGMFFFDSVVKITRIDAVAFPVHRMYRDLARARVRKEELPTFRFVRVGSSIARCGRRSSNFRRTCRR